MKHGYCGFCNYGANELVFLLIRMWLPSVVGVHIRIRDGYSFIGLSINKQEYIISSEGLCFPLACCWVIVLLMKSSHKSCTNRGLMHAHTHKHTAINGQLLIHVQLYYIVPRLKKKWHCIWLDLRLKGKSKISACYSHEYVDYISLTLRMNLIVILWQRKALLSNKTQAQKVSEVKDFKWMDGLREK